MAKKKKTKKLKVVVFSPADENNLQFFEGLKNSLRKFHKREDVELACIGPEQLKDIKDENKFYRMTPLVAKDLIEEWDVVIKIDADSIITGDISHVWEGDFDVAVVNNGNPRETKKYPVSVWDIHPLAYLNCGFVVMKNKSFIRHWLGLCYSPHFESYQMREQDLLNIMVFYMNSDIGGPYTIKVLDAGPKWHGLVSKGYWPSIELDKDDKMWLRGNDEWPLKKDKEIVCLHIAGGNDPDKANYKNGFNPDVRKRIEWLIS